MTDNTETPAPSGRYGSGAMAFHWSTFLLVIVLGASGLLYESRPDTLKASWINAHAVIGLCLWGLTLVRVGWRLRHAPPAPAAVLGPWERHLSQAVHLLLYGLLLITPIIGIISFIYHGRAFDFGIFRIDLGIAKDRAVFHPTQEIHGDLAYAIFGLAGLHALAALWHHFCRRDGVLARMWPK